jgi:hypothetical protein
VFQRTADGIERERRRAVPRVEIVGVLERPQTELRGGTEQTLVPRRQLTGSVAADLKHCLRAANVRLEGGERPGLAPRVVVGP